jgi:hypothetical protein
MTGTGVAVSTWSAAAPMSTARSGHSGTVLTDGRVLVAGGDTGGTGGQQTATAELYDPVTATWSPTGSLSAPRAHHTDIRLADGSVLVLGGWHQNDFVRDIERYDPAAGTWSGAGTIAAPREDPTAVLLDTGSVLVCGGFDRLGNTDLATCELLDPGSGTWTAAAHMLSPRYNHPATLLADGRVLVAGGVNVLNEGGIPLAERYDPAGDTWSAVCPMTQSRQSDDNGRPAQLRLPSGDVLTVGGYNSVQGVLQTGERHDTGAGTWSAISPMTAAREGLHTATLLATGTVLVVGGLDDNGPVPGAEAYDTTTDTWSAAPTPETARARHAAVRLLDGRVLVTGGVDGAGGALATAELFAP